MTDIPTIYIMVGLPASGKSTWITKNLPDTFVVSSDKYIEELAKANNTTYTAIFPEAIKDASARALADFNQSVQRKRTFILDRTNLTAKGRKSFLQKCKGYHKVAVVFDISDEERNRRMDERAEKTGKFISASITNSMKETYVEPSKDEGFDVIIYVRD